MPDADPGWLKITSTAFNATLNKVSAAHYNFPRPTFIFSSFIALPRDTPQLPYEMHIQVIKGLMGAEGPNGVVWDTRFWRGDGLLDRLRLPTICYHHIPPYNKPGVFGWTGGSHVVIFKIE